MARKTLVTGSVEFIGYHLSKRFIELGDEVLGFDNLSDYYDADLKNARLKRLEHPNFSYIDDIIEGVTGVMGKVPRPDPGWDARNPDPAASVAPYRLYNIGNNSPEELERFIEVLEDCPGKKAKKQLLPMQPGDVCATYADVDDLITDVGFRPSTPIEAGIEQFVKWYREYYGV
jgi:nucleoside-diphosphate-sugar epimerase